MKRMFYVCGFVIFGLQTVAVFGISGITGLTPVTGAEGVSGFTEATIALSADGTALAEFKKAYEAFITTVNKSFEPKTES